MFKDYDKYLTTSLKVYLFVLIIIFILKMVGLDYFGLDVNNHIIKRINNISANYYLTDIWYALTLYINTYVVFSVSKNDNSLKTKILCIFITIILVMIQLLTSYFNIYSIKFILEIMILLIFLKFKNIKKFCIIYTVMIIYQILSLITRVGDVSLKIDTFIVQFIMQLDYLMLMMITYNLYFKGGNKVCGAEVYSFSLKQVNLKNLLTKLQKNWHNFKKQDKVTKLTIIIYTIFSLIWNALSLVLILVVARLNDTFIECIFILTSFWLSKGKFGKPFHFKSMTLCFVVSNLSYYTLNRVTTPLGISIIIPVLLGVGLSYVTSKFVKKSYKPLYRGMPEELFEETINKVTDKDSLKYKICYDFYIKKKSVVSLSMKYNYSEAGIRKIKDRINDKIKRLN